MFYLSIINSKVTKNVCIKKQTIGKWHDTMKIEALMVFYAINVMVMFESTWI